MKMYVITDNQNKIFDNFEKQFFDQISPSSLLPTSDLAREVVDYNELEGEIHEIWISETGKHSGEILNFKFI